MLKIPKDFLMGVATSAYQIEGTNYGECAQSHWDVFAQKGGTLNGQDGAEACAHYKHWREDFDLVKSGGFDAYRFSFAWPRILPNGTGQVNQAGLDFYDALIDGLLERGIKPHATLYHWDLPQVLAEKGGWENPEIANWLTEYALVIQRRFGDRLSSLATINEPWCVAWLSHFLGAHAPGKQDIGSAAKAMHNVLYAHGHAIKALRDEGAENLGIVLNFEYAMAESNSLQDIHAVIVHDGLYNRWFISALMKGEYPADILHFLEPHLPANWDQQMEVIKSPVDWIGINYYTRVVLKDDGTDTFPFAETVDGPLPKSSMGWEIYPEGLSYFLTWLHQEYTGDLPLLITENGLALHEASVDPIRSDYLRAHLREALKVRELGVPVNGYFAWSLLDNFEWAFAYAERFGLVHVDFSTQKRSPKQSFYDLKNIISSRILD